MHASMIVLYSGWNKGEWVAAANQNVIRAKSQCSFVAHVMVVAWWWSGKDHKKPKTPLQISRPADATCVFLFCNKFWFRHRKQKAISAMVPQSGPSCWTECWLLAKPNGPGYPRPSETNYDDSSATTRRIWWMWPDAKIKSATLQLAHTTQAASMTTKRGWRNKLKLSRNMAN